MRLNPREVVVYTMKEASPGGCPVCNKCASSSSKPPPFSSFSSCLSSRRLILDRSFKNIEKLHEHIIADNGLGKHSDVSVEHDTHESGDMCWVTGGISARNDSEGVHKYLNEVMMRRTGETCI